MKRLKEYRGRIVIIVMTWKSGSKIMMPKEDTLMNCELLCTDYLCLFVVSLVIWSSIPLPCLSGLSPPVPVWATPPSSPSMPYSVVMPSSVVSHQSDNLNRSLLQRSMSGNTKTAEKTFWSCSKPMQHCEQY